MRLGLALDRSALGFVIRLTDHRENALDPVIVVILEFAEVDMLAPALEAIGIRDEPS